MMSVIVNIKLLLLCDVQQGGLWMCYHIDDLHPETEKDLLPSLATLEERSLGTLYGEALLQKNIPMVGMDQSNVDVLQSPDSGIHSSMMDVDMEASWVRVDEEGGVSGNGVDPDDIVMEMDDNGEAMPGSPGTPPRAQEVPCRKQAGDFRGMHLGFRTMNLSQALKSTPDQRGGRPIDGSGDTSEACLDVDSLIRKCIHKAAAMVKDYEPDTDRKTKRVQMLLKLLNTSAGNMISQVSLFPEKFSVRF